MTSINKGFAEMFKNGVIMDVTTPDEAIVAEKAGACSVMALERVPSDIRKEGGVARMSDPGMIKEIMKAVSIPVMAKARIGHISEARILEAIEVDFIDESEVLTPADDEWHLPKSDYSVPFVCGARNLGEALRRVDEGASMIRSKGEAGTGNIVEAVRHHRTITREIGELRGLNDRALVERALEYRVPVDLIIQTRDLNRLPVVTFSAGGIATPADAALMMELGCDGVFVGSGVFKSTDPEATAKAIVEAVIHYKNPGKLAEISSGLPAAMKGLAIEELPVKMAERGV